MNLKSSAFDLNVAFICAEFNCRVRVTASFPDSALSSPPIWLTTEDKEDILRLRRLCLSNTIRANRKRRLIMQMAVHHLLARRRRLLYVCSLVMLLLSRRNAIARVPRRRVSYTKKKIPACQTCILCWREARTIHTILDSRHIAFLHPRFLPASFLCACHVA